MARAKILLKINEEKANSEFGTMISDIICRGVKYSAIKCIMEEYEELKHPKGMEKINRVSQNWIVQI